MVFQDGFGFCALFAKTINAEGIPGDMSTTGKSMEGQLGIRLFAFSPFRLFPPNLFQPDGC
jgi:hypothetical protein